MSEPANPVPVDPVPVSAVPPSPHWTPEGLRAPELPTQVDLSQLPPMQSFLRAMQLDNPGARTRDDTFTGTNIWDLYDRVFGGQAVAQSVIAAGHTVDDDRVIHSIHGYFMRPGNVDEPLTFSVSRLFDGASFSTRSVTAYQNRLPMFTMLCSFQVPQEGLEHSIAMPEGIPDPESLPDEGPIVSAVSEDLANYWVYRRPFHIRHVEGQIYTAPAATRTNHQAVWFKAVETLPDDDHLHRAALGFLSDYTVLESLLRSHGLSWATPGLRAANLDHAVWWHRSARVDEWLLYLQESSTTQGGRGLIQGRIFTREGLLVATVTQEGMVRISE